MKVLRWYGLVWLIMINYYQLDDLSQLTLVSVTRDEWLEF